MNEESSLSIVVPVYNEEKNIKPLHSQLAEVLASLGLEYEIIFVDDGSTDRSLEILRKLQSEDPHLKIIQLRRNFGQHAATYGGFDFASGDIIVTLDGDLQNDPHDIPKLLEKMKEGYDIVCGWRQDRKDPLLTRRWPSKIMNRFISSSFSNLVDIHDYGCFLRAYKNYVGKEISKFATISGWFPVLFGKLGFSVGEVPVKHRPRRKGESSKHSFFKRFDQFMSIFAGVATRPFQIVEFIGVAATIIGFVSVALSLLLLPDVSGHKTLGIICLLSGVFLLLWGMLTVAVGLIGEYVIRMNYEIGNNPKYLVKRIFKRQE